MRNFICLLLLIMIPALSNAERLSAEEPPVDSLSRDDNAEGPPKPDDQSLSRRDTENSSADSLLSVRHFAVSTADTILNGRDTVAAEPTPKMAGKLVGFGVGLSVGSIALFRMWQDALPTDIGGLRLSPDFGADLAAGDTALLSYASIETPDQFNFTLPFSLSLYRIKSRSAASLTATFSRNSKQFQASLSSARDSVNRRINILETLSYTTLALEATYMTAIPPAFFSIDGSEQTYLTMSVGAGPVNYLSRKGEVKGNFDEDDPRMTAVRDSVGKMFTTLSSNGMSLTWRIGISAIKNHQRGGGLEIGLYYGGSYTTYFHVDGERIPTGRINANHAKAGKPLSFISNRIEFKVSLMNPLRRQSGDTAGRGALTEKDIVDEKVTERDVPEDNSADEDVTENNVAEDDTADENTADEGNSDE